MFSLSLFQDDETRTELEGLMDTYGASGEQASLLAGPEPEPEPEPEPAGPIAPAPPDPVLLSRLAEAEGLARQYEGRLQEAAVDAQER